MSDLTLHACVVAPVIMERREAPILLLGSCNLAYTYRVVSCYEKCYYCGIANVMLYML